MVRSSQLMYLYRWHTFCLQCTGSCNIANDYAGRKGSWNFVPGAASSQLCTAQIPSYLPQVKAAVHSTQSMCLCVATYSGHDLVWPHWELASYIRYADPIKPCLLPAHWVKLAISGRLSSSRNDFQIQYHDWIMPDIRLCNMTAYPTCIEPMVIMTCTVLFSKQICCACTSCSPV